MKLNLDKVLKKNKYIIYQITGSSMYPLLKEGDRVKLETSDKYNLFDVVLFKRRKNIYVLHRIINVKDNAYIIIGDNADHIDCLKKENLIAKLTGLYINNKLVEIKSVNQNFPFKDKFMINSLIANPKNFFLGRLKAAYYELIKLATLGKYDENKITTLTQRELISLCYYLEEKKALHLLGFAIDKFHLLINKDISASVLKEYQSVIVRTTKLNYIVNTISDEFNKRKIKHIFLKGSDIKQLYKYPFLRNSNDIDILVNENEFNLAKKALLNNLLCKTLSSTKHDESFLFNKLNIKIELHKTVSSILPSDLRYLLDTPFKNATIDQNNKYRYRLNKDEEFLYFISHIAKHLRSGAFWYSSIIDYYYLSRKKADTLISDARLTTFYSCLDDYVNHIYFDTNLKPNVLEFENLLFKDSNKLNMVISTHKTTKIKYLFSRFFLSYSELKTKYNILEKHPSLFPALSIYRWISLPFTMSKSGKEEINALKKENDSIIIKLKNIGLNEYLVDQEEN